MERKSIEKILLVLVILLALSTALMIYLSDARSVSFDRNLYTEGFQKYDIQASFNSSVDLMNETGFLLNYLESGEGAIQSDFFNEREKSHLVDVRGLYKDIILANKIAAYSSMVLLVLLVYFYKRLAAHMTDAEQNEKYKHLLSSLLIYTGAIVDVVAVLFVIVAITFDTSFITFHQIFFTSDTWMLNPETDNLIRMFPEGFFYDMFIRIILMSIVFATLLLVIGFVMRLGMPKLWKKKQ